LVKVKICGITNLEDALVAVGAGADALGFVFYEKSPRYISLEEAVAIDRRIPKKIKKIGVFVNEKQEKIKEVAKALGLYAMQFHGDESIDFCSQFKGYRIIKAIRLKDKSDLKDVFSYPVWGILFDSYQPWQFGGTGQTFDWSWLKGLKLKDKLLFISGGLNAENVVEAIRIIRPDWVDVSSSLEICPGKKNPEAIRMFVQVAKKVKLPERPS